VVSGSKIGPRIGTGCIGEGGMLLLLDRIRGLIQRGSSGFVLPLRRWRNRRSVSKSLTGLLWGSVGVLYREWGNRRRRIAGEASWVGNRLHDYTTIFSHYPFVDICGCFVSTITRLGRRNSIPL
jgi:hypothetical protein